MVLVIGGAGYIGSALIPQLLDQGRKVRLLDCFLYGTESIKKFADKVEIIETDFRDTDTLINAMRDVDTVVHLAAIVGDQACDLDPELTKNVNYYSAVNVARLAKDIGVNRFIFSSTCSVYGASDDLLSEKSELNPVSLYAKTKIDAEQKILALADDKFVLTVPRFSTVFGLSGRSRFDLVVNLLTAKAVFEGQITVFGGRQWRPFVHVIDAAKAIVELLKAPAQEVSGQVFNVGSNAENYTINEVGRIINQVIPAAKIKNFGKDQDNRNYRVIFDKIKSLGYQVDWSVMDGVVQIADAIKSGQITDYTRAEYSNLKYMRDRNAIEKLRKLKKVG